MAEMSGGEALTQSLIREGVEVVFGIPGIHMSGSVVAMRDDAAIEHITTRHEGGATNMAYGYARASGKPGVALVVPGAGVYNAASGMATAFARSTPVLLIAGQISRPQMGKDLGAIHEVFNQMETLAPVTKWRRQAMRPREIPAAVSEAFRQMRTGRPRPVYLEMPPEVAVEREEVQLRDPSPVSRIVPSPDDLRRAADVIANSKLPLIYAGGGVMQSGAEGVLRELAETTNIPVITSSGGKGAIPDNHPLTYGSCLSPAAETLELNQLLDVMQSADCMIGVGARFSIGNPAGEACTLININIDDRDLTRIQANTLPLHGDAKATLEALLPFLKEAGAENRPSPAEAVEAARRLIAYYDIRQQEPQYAVLETIKQSIPEETITVWDVTQFGYYSRTHYQVNLPGTYIDSGFSFNLGHAFPTALGAKVGKPDTPVVCFTGDGGFMFNASELSTAVKYGINTVTVVFRDDAYGNVARDLEDFFGGSYGTDLHNPDLVKFAESFGAVGLRTEDPSDLATLLPEALALNAPVVIDVPVGHLDLPRSKFMTHLPRVAWTQPQQGMIAS